MVLSDKRYFFCLHTWFTIKLVGAANSSQKVLLQTYNLFGFQDGTGLPGQRSLKALNGYDLHNSNVAIESIHILSKL